MQTQGTGNEGVKGVPSAELHRLSAVLPAVAAILFGVFLIFGAGFAQPSVLHNAAHDARHAFAFPCH